MTAYSLQKLQDYIEKNEYKGYDPYDGLMSPIFNIPIIRTNKKVRLYFQQFIKRFPFNLRPLFFIRKGCNPVTLGLCLQGYTYLIQYSKSEILHSELTKKINFLIDELITLQTKGFSGACWGYDFTWQSSIVSIPAFGPTVVATGIITNALFEYHLFSKDEKAKNLIISSAIFVLNDLNRTEYGNSFCFSYSPFDRESVFNANMKAVRLLAQAFYLTNEEKFLTEARSALKFVTDSQNADGSWFYSSRKNDNRIDNYHTGYILDCMKEYSELTGDKSITDNIERGFDFYINNFIENERIPKFFHNKPFPIDCTAAAQTILTLCKFGKNDLAKNVANYVIGNMQDESGYFYYQIHRFYKNRIPYMRWSNAWMFLALSFLLRNLSK